MTFENKLVIVVNKDIDVGVAIMPLPMLLLRLGFTRRGYLF